MKALYRISAIVKTEVYEAEECKCCGTIIDENSYTTPISHREELEAVSKADAWRKFVACVNDAMKVRSEATGKLYSVAGFKAKDIKLVPQEVIMRRQGYPELFSELEKQNA